LRVASRHSSCEEIAIEERPLFGHARWLAGTARIACNGWLRERLAVAGRAPELVLVVTVAEAFMHCTKCMVRSQMWQPQSWRPEGLASIGEAMVVHGDLSVSEMRALAETMIASGCIDC
jgi:uncharacterized protein